MRKNNKKKQKFPFDIIIIGGMGHVGLPLGLAFADRDLRVCLYDVDSKKSRLIRKGKMPFIEYGAEAILKKVLKNGKLKVSLDINDVSRAKYVIIAIGTEVDEHLNPKIRIFFEAISKLKKYLRQGQTIIVRSTVYPRTCGQLSKILGGNKKWHIAYCPERIVQGYAIKELPVLPQIIAGITKKASDAAAELFSIVSPKIIRTSMREAELAKLFINAWRYIQFAATNQFYMIAENFGVDYDELRRIIIEGYGRAADLPSAGFAAGPCLLKDTMQLSAFNGNNFLLGHAAMLINEGLPSFIVENLRKKYDLSKKRVGILGMAFKADIDDIRDALSYKLGKILRFYGADVSYSDEYVKNHTFISKEKLIERSDIVIIGVPHSAYKRLLIPNKVDVVDLWGIVKKR